MAEAPFPEPVFVGGPGRSGTHPVGRLIGADPRYHLIRTEARFHAVQGGLPDLLAGRTALGEFLGRLRGEWWQRGFNDRQGLRRVVDRPVFDAAVERFEQRFEADPWDAARTLIRELLDPAAEHAGKPAWVELTGRTIESAPTLLALLPSARFVNMVRDGRAVAAGVVRKTDKTDNPERALAKWEQLVRSAHAAIAAVPEEAVLLLNLDELVATDRERSLERLIGFLGLDDTGRLRSYFDARISAERAHFGGWRERLAPGDVRRIERRYRGVVRDLHSDGVWWAPAPEPARRPRLRRLRIPTVLRG